MDDSETMPASDRPAHGPPVRIALWSTKGGSGVTATAAMLALGAGDAAPDGGRTVLVDACGDAIGALGAQVPRESPGLADCCGSDEPVSAKLAQRLPRQVTNSMSLLHYGDGVITDGDRAAATALAAAANADTLIMDLGCLSRPGPARPRDDEPHPPEPELAARRRMADGVDHSILVTRACYLSLRRVAMCPVRPTGVILIEEPGRALTSASVENAVGAPVVAIIPHDPAVARSIDAGLTSLGVPSEIRRRLRVLLTGALAPAPEPLSIA